MYMRLVFIPKRLACHVDVSLLDWLKTCVSLFSLQTFSSQIRTASLFIAWPSCSPHSDHLTPHNVGTDKKSLPAALWRSVRSLRIIIKLHTTTQARVMFILQTPTRH